MIGILLTKLQTEPHQQPEKCLYRGIFAASVYFLAYICEGRVKAPPRQIASASKGLSFISIAWG